MHVLPGVACACMGFGECACATPTSGPLLPQAQPQELRR